VAARRAVVTFDEGGGAALSSRFGTGIRFGMTMLSAVRFEVVYCRRRGVWRARTG